MHFFKSDFPTAPLEDLLTRWQSSLSDPPSPSSTPTPDPPTLDHFLADEDILRECRSGNSRLIDYICHLPILAQLVKKAFKLPPVLSTTSPNVTSTPTSTDTTASASQPSPSDANHHDADDDPDDRERQLKFAYVASELLSADNKLIADAILSQSEVLDIIFASLEHADQGMLDTVVALHFSKVMVSLLKMKNVVAIQVMARRGPRFINGVLKHISSAPIAELLVRMLDGPEQEGYATQVVRKPPEEALVLLAGGDILQGLAECFVKASTDNADMTVVDSGHVGGNDTGSEERAATLRRLKEETMSNVTSTILGITDRALQLPDLSCPIPPKLCPYMTPAVVSRLLDAGLYATCTGKPENEVVVSALGEDASNEERVEAFCLRSNSALLHSLGLTADLMTTEANVVRDEDEDTGVSPMSMSVHTTGGGSASGNRYGSNISAARQMHSGRGSMLSNEYTGMGGRKHVSAAGDLAGDLPSEPSGALRLATSGELRMLAEHAKKKAGDPIVETIELEAELAIRFPRLSEMFGDDDEIEGSGGPLRPLGSLRLKLSEFFVACMKKASQDTVDLIVNLGVPKKLLELFSKYQWSSILHGVVTKSIVSALEGEDVGRPARSAWFGAGLIPWLVSSWHKNMQEEAGGTVRTRAGYMGHLIRIGTSLKIYIEECKNNPKADLPPKDELQAFAVFAEQMLAPAHNRESTPLCGEQIAGGGSDVDGEEATEVLDMGGITFVENLSQTSGPGPMQFYDAPRQGEDADIDDDEEIKAVEVDDLDHFGADDDDIQIVKTNIVQDIPPALRERLSSNEDTSAVKMAEEEAENSKEMKTSARSEAVRHETQAVEEPQHSEPKEVDREDIKEIDNVDSSSEDEGSYVAFVDDQKDDPSKVAVGIANLHLNEDDASTPLDGVVTEIDEPGPLTPSGNLQSLADNVIAVSDENENSSDEEYEAWDNSAKVVDLSDVAGEVAESNSEDTNTKNRAAPVG